MVSTAARGIIIKQTVLEDRCDIKERNIHCMVKIEADVKPLTTEIHKQFSVIKALVQEFIFPAKPLREHGLKLRVMTPKGLNEGIESVLIIATREEGHFLNNTDMQNPTISDLMKELSVLDPVSWAEKTVGYEVRK